MTTVSVIIPTYNRAHFITEALESVFAQTCTDYEVIVVDDGSTDNTEEVLAPYMNLIRYIKQDNAGPSVARNRGIFAASGEYIAFLDSDDLWYPEKLEKQLSCIRDKNASLCFTDLAIGSVPFDNVVSYNRIVSPFLYPDEPFFIQILCGCIYRTSTVMCRRRSLEEVGVFDPLLCGGEDQELWIRLTYRNKIVYLDEILTFAREHDNRTVYSLNTLRSIYQSKKIIITKWSFLIDTKQRKMLTKSVVYWLTSLAWSERKNNHIKNAGVCFLDLALVYRFSWGALIRGVLFRYFTPIVEFLDSVRGKRKNQ